MEKKFNIYTSQHNTRTLKLFLSQAEKEVLLSCVQEILEAIDENNDGEITRQEFVENARKSSFIKDLIGED